MSFNKQDGKYYGYIYKIYNTVNNKIYIGQTRRTIDIRWRQHLLAINSERDGNTILYRAMRRYGVDKFHIQLIQEYACDSQDGLIQILNENEIKYIAAYNSVTPNGYNMQLGGKSPTESLKCPVDKYYTDGTYICTYKSISDAIADLNIKATISHISECCAGNLYTAYGFVWRYQNEPFDKYDKRDKRTRTVDVYQKDGTFIGTFLTVKEAMLTLLGNYSSAKSSHISACCRGKRNNAYGYVWRFNKDPFDLCLD